jgi:DNA-binding CsgD family transcriptional regulator
VWQVVDPAFPPEWKRLVSALHSTALPAVLVAPPSEKIVAANTAAARVLEGCPDDLVGRGVDEFIVGGAARALELLADGALTAYETRRTLRNTGHCVRVWVRMLSVQQPRCAVAVLLAERGSDRSRNSELPWGNVVAVGSVDASLVIAHMTPDITGILGFGPGELEGTSLLQLVDPIEVAHLLEVVTLAPADETSVAQSLRARLRVGGQVRCEVVLVPNAADGGYAFTIVAVGDRPDRTERALQSSLQLLPAGVASVPAAEGAVPMPNKEQLARLGSRELEVVTELLNGNRVQAIARKLFLSPGTVRNHLSTAYRKLGVTNQQELIDLLRGAAPDG